MRKNYFCYENFIVVTKFYCKNKKRECDLLYVDFLYSNLYYNKMNKSILNIFGENLKKYRMIKGISQEKFAEVCGLHRTYISDIERFKRNISLDNIQKIAEALGIEAYKLFIKDGDK